MTPQGRAYVIRRLTACPTLSALKAVWEGLGNEYARDPEIRKLKDELKGRLE